MNETVIEPLVFRNLSQIHMRLYRWRLHSILLMNAQIFGPYNKQSCQHTANPL